MKTLLRIWRIGLLWVLGWTLGLAHAHKSSDAYLVLADEPSSWQLSIALKDIDAAQVIDANGDGQITWGELQLALPQLLAWTEAGLSLQPSSQDPTVCELGWTFDALERRSDGVYLRWRAVPNCRWGSEPRLRYTLMQGVDETHRLLITGRWAESDVVHVLQPGGQWRIPNSAAGHAATAATTGGWSTLWAFMVEGVRHLLAGYDHLAFLLALLLPVAALRDKASAWSLLRTVTGFTVGHSVTLVLATLGWLRADGPWIEPVIALSIAVSAALNLRPVAALRPERLALGFGLIHGLGFAGLMLESGANGALLPWALTGFNLGVELGQLLVVLIWLLLQTLLAHWLAAQHARIVHWGSWALIALALFWFWQRI